MQITGTSTVDGGDPKLPDPTKRNNFYYGKLMDAYHFELETNYLNAKRWLLSRLVSGFGVVCGLDVKAGDNENEIVVTPGLAIDRWGREIIVQQNTASIQIPVAVSQQAAERSKSKPEECCVQVLICYHECKSEPAPVLASECGCNPTCVPGAISERYRLEFRPGCAPPIEIKCAFPNAASAGNIDYPALAKWVTREKRCLGFMKVKDPCIPLANIPVIEGGSRCRCGPEHIDIGIRPIVFSNRFLFDLLLCLETEQSESEAVD
jgi:hypothetical protein